MVDTRAAKSAVASAIRARGGKVNPERGDFLYFSCPLHNDKNPSAWTTGLRWGCRAGCADDEPIHHLADLLGFEVPQEYRVSGSGEGKQGYSLEDYAESKHLSVEKLKGWGLETQIQHGRAVLKIPYYDANGQHFRDRYREGSRRWWAGQGLPIALYGLWGLSKIPPGSDILVVEGESDCHAAWSVGLHAVGVPGATAWKPEWAKHLEGLQVYVWQEHDEAGEQFTKKISESFPDARILHHPDFKDFAALFESRGKVGSVAVLSEMKAKAPKASAAKAPVPFIFVLDEVIDRIAAENKQPIDAVPTPFPRWNGMCRGAGGGQGLARGWHVVVGAATGRGKSILATQMVAQAVRCGERAAHLSLEMESTENVRRYLAMLSGVDVRQLERGAGGGDVTLERARDYVLDLYKRTGGVLITNDHILRRLSDIESSIRYLHEIHGVRFFTVDYLQLAKVADPRLGIYERVVEISEVVRGMAKSLGVVTVGLSQMQREGTKQKARPQVENLLGGSPLENDADQVVLVDHSRLEVTPEHRRYPVLLEKNRHGPTGEWTVEMSLKNLQLRELMPDEEPSWTKE